MKPKAKTRVICNLSSVEGGEVLLALLKMKWK